MTTRGIIRNFILSNFYLAGTGQLLDDTSLLEAGIIDSTGVLEVLAFVEREFGIKADDEDIVPEYFDSIARIVRYVEGKLARVGQEGLGQA